METLLWIVGGLVALDILFWIGGISRKSGEKKVEKDVLTMRVEWLEQQYAALRDDLDEHDEDLDDLGRDLTNVEAEMETVAECLNLAAKMTQHAGHRINELDSVLQAHIECSDAHYDVQPWEAEGE